MSQDASNARSYVVPGFHYRDAHAAVAWLCDALGFEEYLVVPDDGGGIAHAELTHGTGMIMLGSARGEKDTGAGGAYLVVADPDAHYRRAVAAGAEVITELEDKPYGGRGYAVRDPEGNEWSVGSYDPWASGKAR